MSEPRVLSRPVKKIGIVQVVLAAYRRPFFERLAAVDGIDLHILAGQPRSARELRTAETLTVGTLHKVKNRYLRTPAGLIYWQTGASDWLRYIYPDILVVPIDPRLLSSQGLIDQMHRRGHPVIGWGLGELPRSGPAWVQRLRAQFAGWRARSVDAIIAYSSKAADDYAAMGVPRDRLFVAYNAIDNSESELHLHQLDEKPDWRQAWRASLGLDAHLPIIVFVGRLIREKRIEVLIQACLPLVDRCQLLIVGDGPARTELEALATIRSPQIRFAGHQTGESLAHCFIGSDIFALPGAGGLAIHQAMSYGKPVIVSFGDGTEQDLVVEGENGLFFKTADSDDLAQKISCLLDYPVDRIAAMGQRSLEIVRTKRSLTTMVEVFEAAFEAVTRNGQVLPEMSRE